MQPHLLKRLVKMVYDCIVVGGGISGVSFAHALQKKAQSVLLLEQSNRLGGCIHTYHYDDNFWVENGAHTLYNSYHNTLQSIIDQGLTPSIQKRIKAPFFLSDHKNQHLRMMRKINPIMMAIGVVRFKLQSRDGLSVSRYFTKIFGKYNYDKVLKYCFDAVLCQDSENFPASYLFKTRKKNKHFPRSFTLEKGLSQLFIQHPSIETNMNCTVKSLHHHNQQWEITTDTGILYARSICLATPWHVSQKLLNTTNHPLANSPHQPQCSPITSISLIFDKASLTTKRFSFNIGIDQDYYSFMSRDVINHPKYRALTVYAKGMLDDKAICDFLKNFIKQHQLPTPLKHISHYYQLPKYQTQHSDFLQHLEKHCDDHLYLCGNYFTRLAIEDCLSRSTSEIKRYFSHKSIA